jgi:multicomponent Na+:H+ antiporter subunit F
MLLYIYRVTKGPTIWDRLLGLSLISSKIILITVLYASINGISYLLDFAVVYALMGFISIIFVSLFIMERIGRKK